MRLQYNQKMLSILEDQIKETLPQAHKIDDYLEINGIAVRVEYDNITESDLDKLVKRHAVL